MTKNGLGQVTRPDSVRNYVYYGENAGNPVTKTYYAIYVKSGQNAAPLEMTFREIYQKGQNAAFRTRPGLASARPGLASAGQGAAPTGPSLVPPGPGLPPTGPGLASGGPGLAATRVRFGAN